MKFDPSKQLFLTFSSSFYWTVETNDLARPSVFNIAITWSNFSANETMEITYFQI